MDSISDAIDRNDISKISQIAASGVLSEANFRDLLIRAAARDQEDILTILLDAGANINASDGQRKTAAHFAVAQGRAAALKLLIARGADLTLKDSMGMTALNFALRTDDDRFAIMLLDAGASVDHDRLEFADVVHAAIHSAALLKRLIALNVKFERIRSIFGSSTVLHTAAASSRDPVAVLRTLVLVAGLNVDITTGSGQTPLHAAARHANERALRTLVDLGADVDRVDFSGMTALQYHCHMHGHTTSYIEVLLAAGADPNAGNMLRRLASERFYMSLCAMVAAGANIDLPDDYGDTARSVALRSHCPLPNDDDIDAARRRIAKARLTFVQDRALCVCIGLQSLNLDALQLCEILLHACGPVARLVPFHHWWKIATTVKHFQARASLTMQPRQSDNSVMPQL